jgi:hypothetical protein
LTGLFGGPIILLPARLRLLAGVRVGLPCL